MIHFIQFTKFFKKRVTLRDCFLRFFNGLLETPLSFFRSFKKFIYLYFVIGYHQFKHVKPHYFLVGTPINGWVELYYFMLENTDLWWLGFGTTIVGTALVDLIFPTDKYSRVAIKDELTTLVEVTQQKAFEEPPVPMTPEQKEELSHLTKRVIFSVTVTTVVYVGINFYRVYWKFLHGW